jgi:hypothetical protein
MTIDQRNAGAIINPATNTEAYPVDRWVMAAFGGGTLSGQQSTSVPAGFVNSVIATVTATDTSLGTSDVYEFTQRIEGNNVSDLNWGTANAVPVSLSFWVKSSIATTYSVGIENSAGSRSYVVTYTINSANTWEYKTFSIPGDTTGTWLTTNGIGVQIRWCLATGTNRIASSANTWTAGNLIAIASTANPIMGTNGANFSLTGVQFEVGTVATSFDYRSISTELGLCYRYCFAWRTDSSGYTQYGRFPPGIVAGTTSVTLPMFLPQPMRTTAYSVSYNSKQYQEYYLTGGGATGSTVTLNTDANGTNWVFLNFAFSGTALPTTAGIVAGVRFTNVTDGALVISTEL